MTTTYRSIRVSMRLIVFEMLENLQPIVCCLTFRHGRLILSPSVGYANRQKRGVWQHSKQCREFYRHYARRSVSTHGNQGLYPVLFGCRRVRCPSLNFEAVIFLRSYSPIDFRRLHLFLMARRNVRNGRENTHSSVIISAHCQLQGCEV